MIKREMKFKIRVDDSVTTFSTNSVSDPEVARNLHNWKTIDSGEPITVAVMDSGISEKAANNHPWFQNSEVKKRFDATKQDNPGTDNVGHGTGVASIIARNAPNVEFYSVKIFGDSGSTGFGSIRRAYDWLHDHADEIDVVNMSWGAARDIPQVNRLHRTLVNAGIHDVVAAGNTGTDGGSPATEEIAFSAGAVDVSGMPTDFSSFDPDVGNPDVAALGKNVKMARAPGTSMGVPINEDFIKASGTSFSAPYAAAAYVNALHKKHSDWDKGFMNNARDIQGTNVDGAGVLKLENSISRTEDEHVYEGTAWNFAGNDVLYIDSEDDYLPNGEVQVEIEEETEDGIKINIKNT